jgi:hypothetical protein
VLSQVEAGMVPASVLMKMQATIEKCREAVEALQREIGERDETIRLKDEAIVQLSKELAALHASS